MGSQRVVPDREGGRKLRRWVPCTLEKLAVAVRVEFVFAAAGFEDDILEAGP